MVDEDFTTIRISRETKEELDRQKVTPMGDVTVEDFLKYLLKQNKKK